MKAAVGVLGVDGLTALTGWRLAQASGAVRVIEITARRFAYTPSEIAVKTGERVVLEVKSMDFAHGMSFSGLRLRCDLVPGRVVRMEIPPQAAGRYEFHCDNFCGDEHEDMHGILVVTN